MQCPSGHRWPIRDGYLDCSQGPVPGATSATFESFGFEWNNFDEVRNEDEGFAEVYFRDVDLAASRARSASTPAAARVATPGSWPGTSGRGGPGRLVGGGGGSPQSVGIPYVLVVRSDLRHAPFAPGPSTSSPAWASSTIWTTPTPGSSDWSSYLAPGGQILLYLYSRPPTPGVRSMALAAGLRLGRSRSRLPHGPWRWSATPIAACSTRGGGTGAYGDRQGTPPWRGCPWTPTGANPSAAWCSTPSTA